MNPRNNPPEWTDQNDTPLLGTGKARRLGIGTYGEAIDLETGEVVDEKELERIEKEKH